MVKAWSESQVLRQKRLVAGSCAHPASVRQDQFSPRLLNRSCSQHKGGSPPLAWSSTSRRHRPSALSGSGASSRAKR
jgi:hypothetical protein